jgi:hypothetical protein
MAGHGLTGLSFAPDSRAAKFPASGCSLCQPASLIPVSEVHMMPMAGVPVDAAFEAGPVPKIRITLTGRQRPRHELLDDNRRLAAENARLAEENHALREAAALWIGLYEKQLERANRAISASGPAEPSPE